MASTTVAGSQGFSVSRPAPSPWMIAVSVMLATFMEVLDTSIASVALPYIAGSLSATNDEATWVLTSYLVANAVILPASSVVLAEVWPQAFPDHLHHHLYGFVVPLRRGHQSVDDPAGARGSGRRWWRVAAVVASDTAGELSTRQARHGHGGFRSGGGRGAGTGTHAGRLSHRHLLLALGLLHQHSRLGSSQF